MDEKEQERYESGVAEEKAGTNSGAAGGPGADGLAGLSKWRCPGVFRDIEFRDCPRCGEEVEFFPQDQMRRCLSCGAAVARSSGSCLSHCPAKQSDCYRQLVRAQALSKMRGRSG